ncbi:hypothetical protein AA0312_1937 [Acetobacter tropicalis NRIC 0312]|uniref:UPF0102 protein ATR01nite_05240 n=1 Tax=Acetobacter tropicalis TaxID=104102 RepID=A0A511FJN6_9PROT|nr:YraN family protein [Acetobacter tropicalis]GAL96829.1 endonuclease [Acetobacter tropicalis]GBR70598.1 hypothetical protein AA0312_1937 [Acetobacter tropicalis NRIC 0312]GEL49449.1 UPF0102 protein [Acetobacter tropicalis]
MRTITDKKPLQQGQVSFARKVRGYVAYNDGLSAEETVKVSCMQEGWTILLQRARTRRGEIDIVMRKDNLICFVEVKKRKTGREAAECLLPAQQRRLFRAAECLLAQHPEWYYEELRFDLITVDEKKEIVWIKDIIRQM